MSADHNEQANFTELARNIRLATLDLIARTKSPHIGPSFSIVEILVALYFRIMKCDPANGSDPKRDRFILSKGHSCATLYTVLREKGFLSAENLERFAIDGGDLEQHPLRNLEQGIELSTGSLGHGLSVGAGMALAMKVDGAREKVFVLMGDGELNEGSVWEAAMFAAHHKLNNLVGIVDANKLQALGFTDEILTNKNIAEKFTSFGWDAKDVNGHSFDEIFSAFDNLSPDKPSMIVLDTVKGKGVSFMENDILWHYRPPDEEEYAKAVQELKG